MKQQFETWFAQEFGGEPKTAEEIVFKDSLFMAWSTGRSDAQEQLENTQREFRSADITMQNLEAKCEKLAAENAIKQEFIKTCFRAAADGASLDGADIQELGERLGLFGRETYQPVLHGYICGHEAGEDTVYVMKKTPATDAFLAEVRAQGVEMFAHDVGESEQGNGLMKAIGRRATKFAAQLRKGAAL
ncbi:TPA: hypothetical protein I8X99_004743 [Citrobacter farmeri]|nr:hypothetical protein [Citrobacter farmeri]